MSSVTTSTTTDTSADPSASIARTFAMPGVRTRAKSSNSCVFDGYSTGRPGRENADAVAEPPTTPIIPGRARAAANAAAVRRNQIGSGDRSERIRTYNFPQGRMTDHRINLTLYKLDFIMDGDLDELTSALAAEHQAELLAALADAN